VIIPEIKDAEVETHVLVTELIKLEELPQILGERKDELCAILMERIIAT
jgi:hypothetical protein